MPIAAGRGLASLGQQAVPQVAGASLAIVVWAETEIAFNNSGVTASSARMAFIIVFLVHRHKEILVCLADVVGVTVRRTDRVGT